MREIEITKGYLVLVDAEDYEKLAKYRWYAQVNRRTGRVYARRGWHEQGKTHSILMHRQIMAASAAHMVDHINGNSLDNRRENLRIASPGENRTNSRKGSHNKTGYKGVNLPARGGYVARIRTHEKLVHLGSFPTAIAAALAYDISAREHFGQFARLNFPYGIG